MTLPSEAGYILLYIARSPIIRSPSDSYCFPVQSECGKDRRNEEYNISPIQANIFFTLNLDKPHGLVTLVRVICLISRSAKSVFSGLRLHKLLQIYCPLGSDRQRKLYGVKLKQGDDVIKD